MADERDAVLAKIYKQHGKIGKLSKLLTQKFNTQKSAANLQALVAVVGDEQRALLITTALEQIMQTAEFSREDAKFMLEIGEIDAAASYICQHNAALDGYVYEPLLEMAKILEANQCYLATSFIYRSLLISILKRAQPKTYNHGVRHLKKLDALAAKIADWQQFDDHQVFKAQLMAAHGRKSSFWQKY